MIVFCIGAAMLVLIMHFFAYRMYCVILQGAFVPKSVLRGGVGISVATRANVGVSREIFSHESGLASSAIAVAIAK
jgi:Na+/alanine symporter